MATAEQILADMNMDAKPVVEAERKKRQEAKRRDLAEWLKEHRPYGVSFCTNSMLTHGTVVHCKIEGTLAVIEYEYGWWGLQYSAHEEHRQGEVLGEITVDRLSNRADICLQCAGMKEGRG